MADPHLILCGGLAPADLPRGHRRGVPTHELRIGKGRRDVHLRIAQLSGAMQAAVPDVAADLVELAAYVYAADQAITRGGTKEFEYGTRWRRTLRFEVPVRCPEIWNHAVVRDELRAVLAFLTDDTYELSFRPATDPAPPDRYLTDQCPEATGDYEEVVLFSGGLDSLGGAVEEILAGQRRVALVSHRPVSTIHARQRDLIRAIRDRLPRPDLAPLPVGLEVNKGKVLDREFTQRSRSFLFAALAAVAARQLGLSRVRFYENGVTSLNLPISPQLVGGRASRTTHPQVLWRLGRLFSLLFDTPFTVQNPYQWVTKAEVLERLKAHGHADLAAWTSSCVATRTRTERHPHCGRCSQCLDRRVSALAAGLTDAEDPAAGYESDVLTGERDGAELALVDGYYGMAMDLEGVGSALEFATRYGEVHQALPFTGLSADRAAAAAYELYRRHAAGVRRALEQAVMSRTAEVVRQAYPARSLLGVVLGRIEPTLPDRRLAPTTETNGPPPASRFVVDPDRFEVRLGTRPCFLGNTREFRLVERLWRARGQYLSVETLRLDVWDDPEVEKNTIQRVVSNARRKFHDAGFDGVTIDGSQRDHYQLRLPTDTPIHHSSADHSKP